jgi:hypothetical protein
MKFHADLDDLILLHSHCRADILVFVHQVE